MPFVTFTVRRGLRAATSPAYRRQCWKLRSPRAIAEPTAFTAFSRLDRDDLLVDSRFPTMQRTETDRFMVVE